jgi:hypothetical protein
MTSGSAQESNAPSSTVSTLNAMLNRMSRPQQTRYLISIWDSLTPEEQELFVKQPGNEVASAICDAHIWMSKWTKTRDDQDPNRPYKPLDRPYGKVMHEIWKREKILYIEKSRSMVTSWFAAAEAVHYIQTHQPAKGIFWAQDEDRAVVLRDYAWTLYEQQHPELQRLFPVPRPRTKQSYDKLEWSDGGLMLALPGKDPDKIRSEHPTILVMDEACFIENGGEAFDVALASKVPKIVLVSTAAPSWIRRVTKVAIPEKI